MNKEIKKLWLEELKTTEQCKNNLRIGDKYCVLGVLCAVNSRVTNQPWIDFGENDYSYLDHIATLPDEVYNWAELKLSDLWVKYKGENRLLPHLNNEGVSFEELAKLIQEQL